MPSWIAEIARAGGGKISFERFMELALYHPEHGYYVRHISDIGRSGDFSTALTIGDALVQSITNWARSEARRLKLPNLNIIELGGGGGQLARGILGKTWLWDRAKYQIVEISESLRQKQEREIRSRNLSWQNTIEAALDAVNGQALVIANEFVDAFPCKRFECTLAGWREILLSFDGDEWREQLSSSLETIESSAFSIQAAIGQRVETLVSYRQWLAKMTRHLSRGALLIIDYGGWPEEIYGRRPRGTMRAFFRHERLEEMGIYLRAGRQDLTADVNFLDLRNWGEAMGLTTEGYVNQAEFIRMWNRSGWRPRSKADEYLSDQSAMGGAVRVLHQRKSSEFGVRGLRVRGAES
jgi:SAM-dependent MidA family methyltransferase